MYIDYTCSVSDCKSSMASARFIFFSLVHVLVVNFVVSQNRIMSQGKNLKLMGAGG